MRKWIKNIFKKNEDLKETCKPKHKFGFESLTPTSDADEHHIYTDALAEALQNDNHYNVALTGGYGTGKSSIVETYINKLPVEERRKIIKISLANFNFTKSEDNETKRKSIVVGRSQNNNDEQISLEISILQQIIFQVKQKSVFKKFRKSFENNYIKPLVYSFIIVVTITASIFFWGGISSEYWKTITFLVISTIGSTAVISYLIHKFIKLKVNRFELKSTSISFEDKNAFFSLNSYLDELIYLIKDGNISLLVFEDLDRFKDHEIFEKLREINHILKYSPDFEERRIQFLYVLRESVFKTENDKNKFFDIIIPVVPFISVKNSRDKLLNLFDDQFKKYPNKERQLKDLIKISSLCIDEMRTIKSIFNEYLIYKKVQTQNNDSKVEIDLVSLLAIVIYKNILPLDFENVNTGKSILDEIFQKRDKFEEVLSTELGAIIKKNTPTPNSNDEKENNRKRKIFDEKNKQVLEIPHKNLAQIIQEITHDGSKEIFYTIFEKIKEIDISESKKNLVINLIKDGFIKEDFKIYTSTFQPGSITYLDREILWKIKNGKNIEFELHIDRPKALLEYFTESMWTRLNYLNESLFDEILFSDEYVDNLRLIINQDDERLMSFLNYYFPNTTYKELLANRIFEYSFDFCESAVNSKELSENVFDEILGYIIKENTECWSHHNENGVLLGYLERKDDISLIFSDFEKDSKLIKSFLEHINIKFYCLSNKNPKWLLKIICENNLYEININMLTLWGEVYQEESLSMPSYSNIMKSSLKELKEYVDANLVDFLDGVLLKLKDKFGKWEEEEEWLIELLNKDPKIENANIDMDSVISKVEFFEFNLSDYDEKLWEIIVSNKKLKCTWENLVLYKEKIGIDDLILEIINTEKNIKKIDYYDEEKSKPLDYDSTLALWESLLEQEITKNSLIALKNKYGYYISESIISAITDPANLSVLIAQKAFDPESPLEVYEQIKTHFRGDLIHLEFALKYAEEILEQEDASKVFTSFNKEELLYIARKEFPKDFFVNAFTRIEDIKSMNFDNQEASDIIGKVKNFNFTENIGLLIHLFPFIYVDDQIDFFIWLYDQEVVNKRNSNKFFVNFKGELKKLNKHAGKIALKNNEKNIRLLSILIDIGLVKNKGYKPDKDGLFSFRRNYFNDFEP